MAVSEPREIASEQGYFDAAWDHRERYRGNVDRSHEAGANKGAAEHLRAHAVGSLKGLKGPDEAVAFGRFDEDDGTAWYVGYNAIWGDESEVLVVNWQAPVAAPYYEATHDRPLGVSRRRQFSCEGNRIVDFSDIVFADLAAEVTALGREPETSDILLEELERGRTGAMGDIVRTIQAAQYGIVRAELDQLLVVQGGPGTGKTVLALHRVSWLLFNYRDRLEPSDVLVLGPSRAFVRYIRELLPGLGDDDVVHSDLDGLAPTVRRGSPDPDRLSQLKGSDRMNRLLSRALGDRISVPSDNLELPGRISSVRFDRSTLVREVDRLRRAPYSVGRTGLRQYLRNDYARQADDAPRADALDALVERIWPTLTAASFLRDLLGSEGRLLRAAGDDFSAAEVQLLYRRRTGSPMKCGRRRTYHCSTIATSASTERSHDGSVTSSLTRRRISRRCRWT